MKSWLSCSSIRSVPNPVRAFLVLVGAVPGIFAQATGAAQLPAPEDAPTEWDWIGRPLPTPELLQPTLDPALPSYQPRRDIELSGYLKTTASSVLPGIVQRWITAFQRYYPKVSIEVLMPYVGSPGTYALMAGQVDFTFQSHEPRPVNTEDFIKKFGYQPLVIPISGGSYRHLGYLDAMVFIVHKDNPLDKITKAQADAIFSKTHLNGKQPITRWGQLGLTGEWADKPIHARAITPYNGFEEFMRQRILNRGEERGEWRDDLTYEGPWINHLAVHVAEDRYGMGYSAMGWLVPGVKVLAIAEGEKGPFHPATYEEVALGHYPLSRLNFVAVNRAPGKPLANPVVKEFIRFILSKEGQQVVLDQAIFIPLRAEQLQRSRSTLND